MRPYYLSLLILLFGCNSKQNSDTITPKLNDITESVYASATVTPKNSYFCRSSIPGVIQKVFIKEGMRVSKGDPLFKITPNTSIENKLRNAQISLDEAKENYSGKNNILLNLELELHTLREKNKVDSINYGRLKRLWNQEIGTKNELENALLTYQSSSNQINSLLHQYSQTKINLKNQLQKAKNIVESERSQLDDFQIKSEMDGKVFAIHKQVGDLIHSQEIFAEIGSAENYIIDMYIDEVDISKINVGDTAIIHLDAYPNKVFKCLLSYISDKKDKNTQTFHVEGHFLEYPSKLYNGLSGEVNIVVSKKKNVLTIPSEYLIGENKVKTVDKIIDVELGVKNLRFVEIKNGLDTTTHIIKPN